ncbi:hypothetical protein TDB9533_01853 [Thalassocella blandensis]|nr:hypothetical protein TDB9533_01853 [Thalassocella blandensis]
MQSSKSHFAKVLPGCRKYCQLGCLMALIVLITACEGMGKKPESDQADPEKSEGLTQEGDAQDGAAATPSFVVLPNPYQAGEVPSQAKKEYKKVKALMEKKKWKDAEGALQLMTTTFPTLSGPYINLGIVYQALGQPDEAEKALQFAIETNPQNLDAYTQLGVLYREEGRFNDAEQIYLAALKIWPHHLPSTLNLGILYDLYMGRFEDAMKYYELSQNISGGEDRQLKGWIADLSRRMKE